MVTIVRRLSGSAPLILVPCQARMHLAAGACTPRVAPYRWPPDERLLLVPELPHPSPGPAGVRRADGRLPGLRLACADPAPGAPRPAWAASPPPVRVPPTDPAPLRCFPEPRVEAGDVPVSEPGHTPDEDAPPPKNPTYETWLLGLQTLLFAVPT